MPAGTLLNTDVVRLAAGVRLGEYTGSRTGRIVYNVVYADKTCIETYDELGC